MLTAIAGVGVLALHSAAGGRFEPWAARHAVRYGSALMLMLVVALVHPKIWLTLAWPIYIVSVLMLVAVDVIGKIGMGAQRWLAQHGSDQARREDAELAQRRRQFRALTLATRSRLTEIYQSNQPLTLDGKGQNAMKMEAIQTFRANYATLRQGWGGYAGFDAWVAGANNAAFGAQAVYDELVPAFEALFAREGQQWPRFYEAVRRLAALPAPERARAIQQLTLESGHG